MPGIISFGAYIPRRRLQRSAVFEGNRWFAPGLKSLAKGQRSMAGWDEDPVTMAVEAARDCLGDRDRQAIQGILLASTSFPFADRQNAGIVKEALALGNAVSTLDVGSSQKAGTSALLQACHAARSGDGPVLMIAAEKRRAKPASEDELVNGDGGVAMLLGPGDGVARLVGAHSVTADFVDHFRPSGRDFDYGWESRWVREEGFEKIGCAAVKAALSRHSLKPEDVAHFLVGIPGRGIAAALARKVGIRAEAAWADLGDAVGYVGTAHAVMLLALALERAAPGEKIVLLGFGQGADVLVFEATDAITSVPRGRCVSGWLEDGRPESNYLKFLAWSGGLGLELGKRAEFEQKPVLTAQYRNRRTVLGLIGSRCRKTGTVQFPRSEISVDGAPMTAESHEDYPLADRLARVLTFTADNLTFTLDPPAYYGMIEFDGGGRMLAEFTDVEAPDVHVGAVMRMVFRIKAVDDRTGFVKYFWKAVPTAGRT